jgi:RNA polymerase sigma-70 factor, ECF subfamily
LGQLRPPNEITGAMNCSVWGSGSEAVDVSFAYRVNDSMSSFTTSRFPALSISRTKVIGGEVSSANPSQPIEATDETLIGRVQTGDRDALALLFRRYARSVRTIGKRILRDNGEADDLVQEVFLYIHQRSRLFDVSLGAARSWIFQVTYTQALIRRRQLKSHGFYVSAKPDGPAENELSGSEGVMYELTVEGFFGRNGWKNVWDSLTEYQRETLQLHFYEGCTFAEIAERLGQSYVNIRHHYYRGLEKLREYANENNLNWP